jgi:uncharacterized phiE125 gp8 family phage protein
VIKGKSMATKRIGAASEVITLAEARKHLRIDPIGGTEEHPDDDYITATITSAREWTELYLDRAVGSQTLELALDEFPDAIELKPYVQSVTFIKYIDSDGVEQTIDSDDYTLDNYSSPCWVVPAFGAAFPTAREIPNAVKVRYVAGYDVDNPVPQAIVSAMLLIIGHLYENRQQNLAGMAVNELPMGVCALLQPYRLNIGI